jgi:membrane protease YdiL (CAAX protease family)
LVTWTSVNRPSPGWYPDPEGAAGYRWWDGQAWTPYTHPFQQRPGKPSSPDPPALSDQPVRPDQSVRRAAIPARAAWWGLAGVAAGSVLSLVLQAIASVLFPGSRAASLLLGEIGLWSAFAGTCLLVSRKYGTGRLSVDFGLRFKPSDIPAGLAAFVASFFVAAVIGGLFAHTRYHGSNTEILTGQKGSTTGIIVVAFIAAVGAPIFEELFFRGFLRTALASRLGSAALVVQAILFGLAHYQTGLGWQNLSVVVAISGLGLVLGYTAQRTGRLAAGILAHGLFNLVVTLTIVFGSGLIPGLWRWP